jgi:hypothetical protein
MVDPRPWWASRPAGEVIRDRKPFLHPEVIKRLEGIVHPEMTVLEHGSGGSTLWFEDRVERVLSVERDMQWVSEVKAAHKGKHTRVMHWVDPSIPHSEIERYLPVDLLLIDGEPLEVRCVWLFEATKLVKPGGWIILDNANRDIYKRERQALIDAYPEDYYCFDGNEGITKYLVTDFWRLPIENRTQPVIRRRNTRKVK